LNPVVELQVCGRRNLPYRGRRITVARQKNTQGIDSSKRNAPIQGTLEAQAMGDALRALLAKGGVNANTCARDIGASHSQLYSLLSGDRNISPLLALKLARYFSVSPEDLMLLQVRRDLSVATSQYAKEIQVIVPLQDRQAR
jgi:plasmid maintenance system antidote protein VapI